MEIANLSVCLPVYYGAKIKDVETCLDSLYSMCENIDKKYKDKYNFVALEGNDPRNYTLVQDNVTELPMVYIYDTSIGNKIHIPSTMLGDEEHFFFELDRYLHFRSLLNLEQAVKDHQEAIAKIQKK